RVLKVVRREGCAPPPPPRRGAGERRLRPLPGPLAAARPVLPLDEPLSNLDARLRDEMREEIRRLHRETGLTMVYVTHDQKEALSLANRIAVMQAGKLVQLGPPLELYQRPANRFVAWFLGDCSFIPGKTKDGTNAECAVETPLGILVGHVAGDVPKPGVEVVCAIRPQDLTLEPTAEATNRFEATVDQVSFLGEMTHVRVLAGEAK